MADTAADAEQAVRLVTDDRAALLVRQPFLALLALRLEIRATTAPDLPTVRVTGRELWLNPRFVLDLTPDERRFVVAHAVWHCALLHPWRRAARAPALWDLAIDHEVNGILLEDLDLPPDATFFPDLAHASAEAVHAQLLQRPTPPVRGPRADVHAQAHDEMAHDRTLERVWKEHVLAAAQVMARRGRPLPAAVRQLVTELSAPQVPWRAVLGRYMTPVLGDQRHWLPPNRRHLHRGLYLQSRRARSLRLVVALDTSASTLDLQRVFLGELVGILGATPEYEIVVLQADHTLRSVATYSPSRPLVPAALTPLGGGGTDLAVFFTAISAEHLEPDVVVVLTDGYGPAPARAPSYPVLWTLPVGGKAPAPWGDVLTIDVQGAGA